MPAPPPTIHSNGERMTVTATDLLLEATGVAKTYGAVVALRSRLARGPARRGPRADGRQRRRQEHPRQDPDRGRHARQPAASSSAAASARRTRPAEARRNGLVSVYQEPSLIPDLDIRDNLRLTDTPVEPFRHWVQRAGHRPTSTSSSMARRLPLATLRIVDLARALAIEPDVLLLDEMTAALPANLTERVLEVVGRQRGGERSVIFISHRMIEIAAICDRATVLRERRDGRRRRRRAGLRGHASSS